VRFGSENNKEIAKQIESVGERLEVLPDRILVYTDNGEKALDSILAKGLHPVTTLVRRSSLEDVFLRLTGRTLVD
jgi:lipooligosaccharide transport system ATP-binding protein